MVTVAAEGQIYQQQRPTLNSRYGTILQDDQPVTWWQVDYPGPLPSWKGKYFVFSRIDTYSDNEFAFQVHSASTETTIHGLTKCLAHS